MPAKSFISAFFAIPVRCYLCGCKIVRLWYLVLCVRWKVRVNYNILKENDSRIAISIHIQQRYWNECLLLEVTLPTLTILVLFS